MNERVVAESEKALVDLVKADYDATHRALAGFVASGGQLRAVGIAAWGVIVAGALGSRSATIAAVAVPLVVVFAVADGYYSSLYRQTLRRSRGIEALLGEYHNAIGIHRGSQRKLDRAVAALEQHRFGVHRDMKPVNDEARWTWWIPRPVRITWLYPVLMVVAGILAVSLDSSSAVGCENGRRAQEPCVVFTTTPPTRTVTVTTPATAPPASPQKSSTVATTPTTKGP